MRGKDEAESCRAKNALWAKLMARCTGERAKCSTASHYRDLPPSRNARIRSWWFLSRRQLRSRNLALVISFTRPPLRWSSRNLRSKFESTDRLDREERGNDSPANRALLLYQDRCRHVRQCHLPSLYGPSLSESIAVVQKKKRERELVELSYNRRIVHAWFKIDI